MNDNDIFENGCFIPEWTTDTPPTEAQPQIKTEQLFKNKETLLEELREIKQRMQDIRAKEWRLAKLLEFHNHQLARE